MNFNYASYGTSYGYKISQVINEKKSSYTYQPGMLDFNGNSKPDYDACFSNLYNLYENNFDKKVNYDIDLAIIVAKDETSIETHNKDNYIFLTKEEFLFFLEISIPTLGFSYKVTELDHYYRINIKGEDVSHYQVKFLTTWVRYTYEHPYNACMGETIKLFQLGVFKELDIFNAFLLISRGWSNWGTGHATTDTWKIAGLLPIPMLVKRLKENKNADSYNLNSLYDKAVVVSNDFKGSEFNDKYETPTEVDLLKKWNNKYLPNIKLNNTDAPDDFFIVSKNFEVKLKAECKHLFKIVPETSKKNGINGRVSNLQEKKVKEGNGEKFDWKF